MSDGVLADSLLLFSLILVNSDENDAKKERKLFICCSLTLSHLSHAYLESVLMGKEPLNPSAL